MVNVGSWSGTKVLKSKGFESSSMFCSLAEADVAAWVLDSFSRDGEGGTLYHLDYKMSMRSSRLDVGTYNGDLFTGSFFQSFSGP